MRTRSVNPAVALALVAFAALSVAPMRPRGADLARAPFHRRGSRGAFSTDRAGDGASRPAREAQHRRPRVGRRRGGRRRDSPTGVRRARAEEQATTTRSGPTFSNTDDGNNDAAYADGGIALAVAAGITSLVLFLTGDPADAPPAVSTPHAQLRGRVARERLSLAVLRRPMKRMIRAMVVATSLVGLGASGSGCEVLVELDRSAVDAGTAVCSICADAGADADADADADAADAGVVTAVDADTGRE